MQQLDFTEIFKVFLKRRKLYYTPSRECVVQAVQTFHRPFDAATLWTTVQNTGIGLATIYRTLDLLAESGLIRKIPGKSAGYEVVFNRPAREYFQCLDCGEWLPFSTTHIDGELADIADRLGFTVSSCTMVIQGMCQTCNMKQSEQ